MRTVRSFRHRRRRGGLRGAAPLRRRQRDTADGDRVVDELPEARHVEEAQEVLDAYPGAAADSEVRPEILEGDDPAVHGHVDEQDDEEEGRQHQGAQLGQGGGGEGQAGSIDLQARHGQAIPGQGLSA